MGVPKYYKKLTFLETYRLSQKKYLALVNLFGHLFIIMLLQFFSFFCFLLDQKATKSQGFGYFPTSQGSLR
jgi:hypothetical protein